MSWTRVIVGGVVAGIVTNVVDFVMHGMLLGDTYRRYSSVFSQEQANPAWFAVISVLTGLFAAVLFGKSRASWAPGWKGGLVFGLLLGLVAFWPSFYNPLVIDGFPYHLAWCWGGITLIDSLAAGVVLGAIIRRED